MSGAVTQTRARKRKAQSAYRGSACPACGKDLSEDQRNDGRQNCRSCFINFTAYRLSPLPERITVVTAVAATPDGATPCARHERNASVASCSRCGVFMCQLCRIDSDGLTMCPGCFERLADEGMLPSARKSYRDYGRMSSHAAILGFFLMWPFGVFIGPFAVWFGIKGLRTRAQPGVHISKARCVIAIVLGTIEIVVWLGLVVGLTFMMSKTGRL